MRIPTTCIVKNLRWTDNGIVWAEFMLTGLSYRFSDVEHKRSVRDAHAALYRALSGESLLLGVNASIDPAEVVARMLKDVDLEACPAWAQDTLATLDTLNQIPLGQRVYWLAIPLGSHNLRERLKATGTATMNRLVDELGMPRQLPAQAEIDARLRQARDIVARIPSFNPTPATAAQMMWLHQHMVDRGLYLDDALPKPGDLATELITSSPRAVMGEPLLDEGGRSDYPPRAAFNPLQNKLLKVVDANRITPEPSYQALGVLTKPPTGGMVFPGSEVLGYLDECGMDVDWCQRINVVSRDATAHANQRALDQLKDQNFHTGGDAQDNIARNTDLAMREAALREYVAALAGDELEVETRITTILAIGAPDRETLHEQVVALETHVKGWHHKLLLPVGQQQDLWWAMHPGVATSQTVREYQQITTSKSAAGLVPLLSTKAGDHSGTALAINLANGPLLAPNLPCGPSDLIMHDMDGASERDTVGSAAFAGESGCGKSTTMKKLGDASIDQGGMVIAVDRTEMGEYALWAQARGDVAVLEVVNPRFSFDPLRLFPGSEGTRVAQSFLTMLLNIAPSDDLGMVLSEVLDAEYRARHELVGTGDVAAHLLASNDERQHELGRRIRVFSRNDLGRVVFDSSLPTPDITQSMVIRTNRLKVPSGTQIREAHLFKQLGIEEIFGRAYYALIAGFAHAACFRDRNRMAVFMMDEVTSQVVSPEVEDYLLTFNLDGRKHRAALLVGGQYVANGGLGSARLADSFPTRIVMRMRQEKQARAALSWMLGGHEPDQELVDLVTTDTSPLLSRADDDLFVEEHRRGEFFMRDNSGRMARGKVLAASQAKRLEAAMATGFGGGK